MNYTREPLIETVITPKEGYKLLIRNSKGGDHEEYAIDAVEIVSFGTALFYRSLERPKPFLVPVSDYEIIETKETRVVLKNATFDRAIKIGGGREATPPKSQKPADEPAAVEQKLEKKREKRRHRRRRSQEGGHGQGEGETTIQPAEEKKAIEAGGTDDQALPSSSILTRIIPPPAQLISEKISKEKKPQLPIEAEGTLPSDPVKEKPAEGKRETPPSEGGEAQRIASEPVESLTSTSFSTVDPGKKFSFFGKIW